MSSFDATQAVAALEAELAGRLDVLEAFPIEQELKEEGDLPALLKLALKNEMEASEIAARWMPSTPEPAIKLGFARQVGDEARHYRLIADYLERTGTSLEGFDPLAPGYTPLFQALDRLGSTLERLAAGQFAREAIAVRRNEMFLQWLQAQGQEEIAAIYRDEINPDEQHHHQLGVRGLRNLVRSEADLATARAAMEQTLSIASEMKKAASQRLGHSALPGC